MPSQRNVTTMITSALALSALAGVAVLGPTTSTANAQPLLTEDGMPATLQLTAIIRDFKPKGHDGGHPDFQAFGGSHGHIGLVKPQLGEDGKPVFNSTHGNTIQRDWKNRHGQAIMPSMHDSELGDAAGSFKSSPSKQLTSEERFYQWYNDTPGVNMTTQIPLTLVRNERAGTYVFDSAQHEPYKSIGGFFPINGELFGDYNNWGKNFHFTTEIDTEFVYQADQNQVFRFTGDDDVWVFIDGQLCVDIGGLHPKREQYVEIDRLGLEDGETYSLKIFHAERRTSQSNFRIETNFQLRSVNIPAAAGVYD